MSDKNKIIFSIHGFDIYEDSTYKVEDKPDPDAPTGFVKEGRTKLPGTSESFQCRVQDDMWDTGFVEYSPCYSTLLEKEAKQKAKELFDKVAKPYMRFKGIRDIDTLSPTNDDFWSKQNFSIWEGRVFSTKNPQDVFELYMALNSYQITPSNLKKDPRFNRSAFILVDSTKSLRIKEQREERKFLARDLLSQGLRVNQELVIDALYYQGINVAKDAKKASILVLFEEKILDEDGKVAIFIKSMEDLLEGKNEAVTIFRKLGQMYGSKVTKLPSGTFQYDGIDIGTDLKTAAGAIADNPKYDSIKKEILLSNAN